MLLDKLLSGAVRLWLASQLSHVEKLTVEVPAKEKQILQGYIPKVFINATNIVYQELYLSSVEIKGAKIRFNLPQVLKKKPLQLLEPIAVEIKAVLSVQDARSSLNSTLLQSGLTEIANNLLVENNLLLNLFSQSDRGVAWQSWQWNQIDFAEAKISLQKNTKLGAQHNSIQIETKLELADNRTLLLIPQAILFDSKSVLIDPTWVQFDLGNQVTLEKLIITPQQLLVEGTITVFP